MPIITEDLNSIDGVPLDAPVTFLLDAPRGASSGTGIILEDPRTFYPVAGVVTTDNLDPGPAKVRINGNLFDIEIPETASRLWPLILAGLVTPPASATWQSVVDAKIAELAGTYAPIGSVGGLDPEALAEELNNPETAANSAVSDIVETTLAANTVIPIQVVAGTVMTTARPAWAGPVHWYVATPGAKPIHAVAGDSIFEYTAEAVTIWSDDFNRSDGALGTTPVGAKAWELYAPSGGTVAAEVVSNQFKFTNLVTGTVGYAVVDAGTPNGVFTFTVPAMDAGRYAGGVLRFADTSNNIVLARVSGSDLHWRLITRVANTVTQIAAFTALMAPGDVVQCTLNGTSLIIKVNGVEQYNGTVAALASATKFGLFLGNNGSTVRTAISYDTASFVG